MTKLEYAVEICSRMTEAARDDCVCSNMEFASSQAAIQRFILNVICKADCEQCFV